MVLEEEVVRECDDPDQAGLSLPSPWFWEEIGQKAPP